MRIQAVYTSQGTSTGYAGVGKAGYYSGTWSYFSHTGRLPETAFNTASCGYVYVEGLPASGWAEICGIKVEEGAVATGWSPGEEADASTYITQIDETGIKVSPSNKSGNDYLQITANNIDIYRNGTSMVGIDDTNIRVGKGVGPKAIVNASNFAFYDSSNKKRSQIDTSGLNVYDTDGSTSVAQFAATTTVGKAGAGHITVTPTTIDLYDGSVKCATIKQHSANVGCMTVYGANGASASLYPGSIQFVGDSGSEDVWTAVYAPARLQFGKNNGKRIYFKPENANLKTIVMTGSESGRSFKVEGDIYATGNITIPNGSAIRLNDGAGSAYSWNSIWSSTYSDTSNLYIQADGYIGFYVGNTSTAPTGRMYVNYEGTNIYGYLTVNSYITSGGVITSGSNIRLKNNVSLQGANTSGTYKSLIYISGSNTVNIGNADGATYVNGTSFSGSKSYTGSDLRLKHDIIPLDDRSSELIMSLKPFEYKWNEGQEHFYSKGKCFGLGAQEVSELMKNVGYNPEDYRVVEETPDGYLAICYTELIPHLIYVAQKQQKEIEELKGVIKCIS